MVGKKILLRDLDTGAPVHERTQLMRDEEKTYLPLSGAQVASMVRYEGVMSSICMNESSMHESRLLYARMTQVASMVRPEHAMAHLDNYYPKQMSGIKTDLEAALNKPLGADEARNALTFPKTGHNEMRSRLFILRANSEGVHQSDWRQRWIETRDMTYR
jgi:hypothetical protein